MAKGEKQWSAKGKEPAKRYTFAPLPVADYEGLVDASGAKIGGGNGKFPYVQVCFSVNVPGADGDSGKSRKVLGWIRPSLKADKNGVVTADRADNVLGLCQAFGETPSFSPVTVTVPKYDKESGKQIGMEEISILSVVEILEFFKAHDGMKISFHLRQKKSKDNPDVVNNEIDYYIPAETSSAFGEDEEDEEDEEDTDEDDEETDEDEAEDESEDEDDEDEDEKPAKKSSVKKKGKR